MSDRYKYNTDELLMLKFDTASISKAVKLSFVMSTKLFEKIQSTDELGEKSRAELKAFFDLINQYHGLLCNENIANDPGEAAVEALKLIEPDWDRFYSECKIFKELESVD